MASSPLPQSTDASEVGRHCSVCKTLDFLPFRCSGCRAVFCKAHQAVATHPEQHDCPNPPDTQSCTQITRPAASSGSFKDLLPDRSSTKRPPEPTPEELAQQRKKEAALAILQKNFPQASTSRSGGPSAPTSGTRKPGLSPAVALMKLKRSAKPVDPKKKENDVPQGERRYLTVMDKTAANGTAATVWIAKVNRCLGREGGSEHAETVVAIDEFRA